MKRCLFYSEKKEKKKKKIDQIRQRKRISEKNVLRILFAIRRRTQRASSIKFVRTFYRVY